MIFYIIQCCHVRSTIIIIPSVSMRICQFHIGSILSNLVAYQAPICCYTIRSIQYAVIIQISCTSIPSEFAFVHDIFGFCGYRICYLTISNTTFIELTGVILSGRAINRICPNDYGHYTNYRKSPRFPTLLRGVVRRSSPKNVL